ncbi:unnamed protein product [Clonostachys rhizophaga]|uniref:Uncharacterized protein n=1 Tax=Clonostachys rhizophaga TaxID=160324 RepID=A0A9N9YFL8_9HYPO|nr:unnamed protein product [Clonostachys rhizophaga]
MSGTNPQKRPADKNEDEESAKRRKEKLDRFAELLDSVSKPQGNDNRGRSQTRSGGGHGGRGGSQGGIFHRNDNVQDETQSLVPMPTPDGTLGSGMSRANSLFSLPSSRPLDRATTGHLGNRSRDLSALGSNDGASFTGNGLVSYGATQGLAQRVAPAPIRSLLLEHMRRDRLTQTQSNQGQGQPGDQRTGRGQGQPGDQQTEPASTNPPETSWKDAPKLPRGSQGRARGVTQKKATTPLTTELEGSLGQQDDRWGENLTKAWSELRQAQLWDSQGYVTNIFAVFVPLTVARLSGMDILNGLAELTLEKAGGLEDIRLQSKQLERSYVEICIQVAKGKENRTNLLEVWLMLVQWATTLWMGSPIPLTTWARVWFSKTFPPMTTDSDPVIIFLDSENARENATNHNVYEVRRWTKHYNDMARMRRTSYDSMCRLSESQAHEIKDVIKKQINTSDRVQNVRQRGRYFHFGITAIDLLLVTGKEIWSDSVANTLARDLGYELTITGSV